MAEIKVARSSEPSDLLKLYLEAERGEVMELSRGAPDLTLSFQLQWGIDVPILSAAGPILEVSTLFTRTNPVVAALPVRPDPVVPALSVREFVVLILPIGGRRVRVSIVSALPIRPNPVIPTLPVRVPVVVLSIGSDSVVAVLSIGGLHIGVLVVPNLPVRTDPVVPVLPV